MSDEGRAEVRLGRNHLLWRLALWLAAVLAPLPLLAAYGRQAAGPMIMRQQVALGIVAYTWWLLAILLSLRWRWLECRVGLASIYGLHGMLGLGALALAWFHRASTYGADPLGARLGEWAWRLSAATASLAVFFLSGWIVDHVPGTARARARLERLVPHHVGVWLHRLNLVAVVMVWAHAHILIRLRGGYAGFLLLFDAVTAAVLAAWAGWAWGSGSRPCSACSTPTRGAARSTSCGVCVRRTWGRPRAWSSGTGARPASPSTPTASPPSTSPPRSTTRRGPAGSTSSPARRARSSPRAAPCAGSASRAPASTTSASPCDRPVARPLYDRRPATGDRG